MKKLTSGDKNKVMVRVLFHHTVWRKWLSSKLSKSNEIHYFFITKVSMSHNLSESFNARNICHLVIKIKLWFEFSFITQSGVNGYRQNCLRAMKFITNNTNIVILIIPHN